MIGEYLKRLLCCHWHHVWLGHDGSHLVSVTMLIQLSAELAACATVFWIYFSCSVKY
jgi:hypothetical protein